jgi:predicted hotdog family 3-hydroxylacyl-ACP dehydratase
MAAGDARWKLSSPHRGAMCLLDDVVDWNGDGVHARSATHRRADNPLRSDDRLRSVHLCEYGAQAMAVHGALLAAASGVATQPGLLVSLRAVSLHVARNDDLTGDLDVHAQRLLDAGTSLQYTFRIEHAGTLLAEGRAAVMTRGDGEATR